MTPERFRQMRNLFDAAVERPTEVRPAFLAEACQGDADLRESVSRLLDAHQQTEGVLDQPPLLRGDAGRMEGRRIDHYEILRELGRGGMGSVYLAARTDQVYRKTVAFKVVRPEASSEEVIRRFQQEREIVAGLDHPNIARLLDGGTTPEGLPYFVMEFVDGQPIDVYCDHHQLSVTERLKLFRTVCAAVEYAHGRGVAHRDLKPGNILVMAEGVVKLLDFGIAKLLGEEAEGGANLTRTGLRPMTPEYASPEQVKGESVGAASDQYSLGVVLYELLTGHRPYRMRSRLIHEVVRVICEEDPTPPSTAVTETVEGTSGVKLVSVTPQIVSRSRETTPADLRRALAGDLDNILLRTLRKDCQQRYRTVKDFSEDLQRRLDGLPVTARPQSWIYRAVKFLSRHRGWAIPIVAVIAGLATGTVAISAEALLFLFWFVVSLGVAFILARDKLGAAFAHGELLSWTVQLGAVGIVLVAIMKGAAKRPSEFLAFAAFAAAASGVASLVGLLRWPRRNGWAGRLVTSLSLPRRGVARLWATICAGVLLIGVLNAISRWRNVRNYLWERDAGVLFGFVALAAFVLTMMSQVEIRERGIVYFGLLIRWREVESIAWERLEGEFVILKLRVSGPLFCLWPAGVRVAVSAERRAAVDAILRQQLSEWPGETVAPQGSSATQ